MPKVLIREFDNSTTGILTSNNFAVAVPGYFGEDHTGDEKDILIDYDVYELKSQSDFIKYVGRKAGTVKTAAPPALHKVNNAEDADDYTQYILTSIGLSEFDRYLPDPQNPDYDYRDNRDHIYKVEEITDPTNPKYGKNGHLLATINYVPLVKRSVTKEDANGEPITVEEWQKPEKDDDDYEQKSVTIALTQIDNLTDIEWVKPTDPNSSDPESEDQLVSAKEDAKGNKITFCIISEGDEGSDSIEVAQMGNQIAYELLGLGYTVLYKKLDENVATQQVSMLTDPSFWEPLKDKSVFNFRYVMTGGYYAASAMNRICELAAFRNDTALEDAETYGKLSGRGDCIALCDIDEKISGKEISSNLTIQEVIENIGYAAKLITLSNQYSAIFAPKVTYVMDDLEVKDWDRNKTFPASFHYLACAARTFEKYSEWYAVAGYNRGVSNYSVASTSVKLGEIAINTLAPRIVNDYSTKSVNLILHERGNYYLWGNRTGYALDDKGLVFHHFLNIRQLCCSIKKQLYTACRQFTFDPNSDLLWINFVNAIKPTLEAMRADQGIRGYKITKVIDPDKKKALLKARIRIVPIEAVEDFDISIYLEDSLTGIVVNASEEQA